MSIIPTNIALVCGKRILKYTRFVMCCITNTVYFQQALSVVYFLFADRHTELHTKFEIDRTKIS